MSIIGKSVLTGTLAIGLAAVGFGAAPASAHDDGLGIGLGLATGLIIGGVLADHPHHYYPHAYYDTGYDAGYDAPACYPGPLQWRWQQVCQPDYYGQLECRNVKSYYRAQICN